jgi:uncharacterized protein GlcG (DUF336 family)
MIDVKQLTLDEANLMLDAAQAVAEQRGVAETICISDAGGWPIAVRRLDGGKPTSVEIAINKAFAQPNQEAFGIMNMHGGRFTIFVGGWPIEFDGAVVGGVGVSGGHTADDIACCQAAITALHESLGSVADFSKWDNWTAPPA